MQTNKALSVNEWGLDLIYGGEKGRGYEEREKGVEGRNHEKCVHEREERERET